MSGVLVNGKQYEKCNQCGKFTLFSSLLYELPTENFVYGRDLCLACCIELGYIFPRMESGKRLLDIDTDCVSVGKDFVPV